MRVERGPKRNDTSRREKARVMLREKRMSKPVSGSGDGTERRSEQATERGKKERERGNYSGDIDPAMTRQQLNSYSPLPSPTRPLSTPHLSLFSRSPFLTHSFAHFAHTQACPTPRPRSLLAVHINRSLWLPLTPSRYRYGSSEFTPRSPNPSNVGHQVRFTPIVDRFVSIELIIIIAIRIRV